MVRNSKEPETGRTELSRRDMMSALGTAGVVGGAGLFGADMASADVIGGRTWPERYARDFQAPFSYATGSDVMTSAATHLELIESQFVADRWRFYFRTETDIGQINAVPDGPDALGYNLNGSHTLEIEETVNSGAMDSYHGTEERNFGVTGAAGPVPDWASVVYNIGTALVGKWNERVGDLITALDIIAEFAFPGNSGEEPEGIFYDWTVNGEGKVGNWLRWTTEYLPKGETGNDSHQITVDTGIDNIPDGDTTTSTSDYNASWTVDLGSMYEPTNMSFSEQKEYGIERVSTNELTMDTSSLDSSEIGPVYKAKNPPVTATLNSE